MKSETSPQRSVSNEQVLLEDMSKAIKNSIKTPDSSQPQSRHEILKELEEIGVNTENLKSMTIEGLADLLDGLYAVIESRSQKGHSGRPRSDEKSTILLSGLDKKILLGLVGSTGRVSSQFLSRELDIPLSTVQRRKSRLDETLVELNYSLKVEELGWKRAILSIAVSSGNVIDQGKEIIEANEMIESIHRVHGGNSIDLKAEVLFRTNVELVALIDAIKSKQGIRDVFWVEYVQLVAKNENAIKKVIENS